MKKYPHYIIDLARKLRQEATPAEEFLWQHLRNRQCAGLKFKRQHHIDRYVADFYCAELHLVVELEGSIHDLKDQKEYDEYRYAYLEARGMTLIRFRNEEVMNNVQKVLRTIEQIKNSQLLSPLLPIREKGAGDEGRG